MLNVKRESIKENLSKLLENGVLGFFNCVEIVEIIMNYGGEEINVITLMCVEYRNKVDYENAIFINGNKRLKISLKNRYFGIRKSYVNIEDFKNIFSKLIDKSFIELGSETDTDMLLLPKRKFVAPNSYEQVPFNSILKNNFFNGSYIYEFVDQNKVKLIDFYEKPILLQELSAVISEYIPITISEVSDKLGSYIVQIPTSIISQNIYWNKKNENLVCEIAWNPDAIKRNLIITCRDQEDDSLLGESVAINFQSDTELSEIPFHTDSSHIVNILDPTNSLILAATRPSAFIKKINISIDPVVEIDIIKKRVFGNNIIQLKEKVEKEFFVDWTERRLYRTDVEKSKKNLNFIQFPIGNQSDDNLHQKALNIIHSLINKYGENSIWLWDPYLTNEELKKTLFHNIHINSEMKAITNSKKSKAMKICSDCTLEYCIDPDSKENNNILGKCYQYCENLKSNIDIDFRTAAGANAGGFHDRFIIFPKTEQGAIAWSLGASLNQYGLEHHILQRVIDGQMIADAFDKLWGKLQTDNQLIWKSKND